MESSHSLTVRKGAWSKDEDVLLKNCVEQYGEGKWHLVPVRTGLNRCRKSCRLRWLNYLRPNITRGNFTKDEVDLLIRMHKLLGNRFDDYPHYTKMNLSSHINILERHVLEQWG